MRNIADLTGRSWTLHVTVDALRRMRDVAHVDLAKFDVADDQVPLVRMLLDPVLLAEAVYAVVLPQAEARGVTKDQFLAALDGQALACAQEALTGELADFFQAWKRPEIKHLLQRTTEVLRQAGEAAIAQLADQPTSGT